MLDWIMKNKYMLVAFAAAIPLGILSAKADCCNMWREIATQQRELLDEIDKVDTE